MAQLSDRLQRLAPSATLAMSQKSSEMKAQGIDVINMSVGEPDFNTPDHIKQAAKLAIDENYSRYSPVPGYPDLRQAIARKLERENQLHYSPAEILVSNGAKQSVCNTVLALVNPGNEVIIPSNAVAVDLIGNEVTRTVRASSNPNCLYFLSPDITMPYGISTNVVRGLSCKTLVLSDDGLPFMPIADFIADSIVYTRTFDSGMTVQGTVGIPSWTTLCLPFTVDRCLLAEGTEANWMKHENDEGYDFWLMEYIGDENGTLFFNPASELRAYTPYLINVAGSGMTGFRDMTMTSISFCGRKTTIRATASSVASSTNYKFVGTMVNVNDGNDAYTIDTDGQRCRRAYVSTRPFRAYVKAVSNTSPADIVPMNIATFSTNPIDKKGDVNVDGVVNVADISAVISLMAGYGTGFTFERADVNGDGEVNVADISAIINIMAGN